MCACKETDVRESPNVSIFAAGEMQGSRGETGYSRFVKTPFPRYLNALYKRIWFPEINFCLNWFVAYITVFIQQFMLLFA
jgi:hypothetical protein